MPDAAAPIEVFYSYAHEDETLRNALEKHLSLLRRQGLISSWHDRQIVPGTDWAKAISTHLETATLILLLISVDFLASDYCYGIEVERAMERHEVGEARVIPILLRPVENWRSTRFGKLQALPSNGIPVVSWHNQDNAFVNIVQGIRIVLQHIYPLPVNTSSAELPPIWDVPHPHNPIFMDPDDVLTRLDAQFQEGKATAPSQPQAISRLGSIGKRQVVRENNLGSGSFYFKERSFALLALLVGLIGLPAVLVPLAHIISPSPWLAILFVISGWGLAFVGSLLTEIWQRLKAPWVEALANTFDQMLRSEVSHYHARYCEYFVYEHRNLDVKGTITRGAYTLAVKDVFVELCLDPKPSHETSSDPLHVPMALRSKNHTIWEFLAAQGLRDQGLALLGPPGSGKTTLLRHIGLAVIQHTQPREAKWLPQQLPVLLFLREHVQAITVSDSYSLADAVRDHVQRWPSSMPAGWIEHRLDRGQCLVLLDGLDEVANVLQRKQVVVWVERQMINYHRNRFLLTSRPFGYRRNPLAGVTILEVQPFTFQQAETFVMNWYLANEIRSTGHNDPGVQMTAERSARDLLRRLREMPALLDLAVNPLLLTMIATVHQYRGTLPGARIGLYEEICEVFLGKRQEARGVQQNLRADQRQLVLQPLAYIMMLWGIRDISSLQAEQAIEKSLRQVSMTLTPHNFLDDIQNSSGLFLERELGIYSFTHKTFQEYLAAVSIKEEGQERILVDQVQNDWWHETIRLYCAKADATAIIEACLQATTTETLILALECQREALRVEQATQHRLQMVIDQGIEDADLERRRVTAEVLLSQRLRQMYALDERTFIATSLVTHAEYQLFLDERQQQGEHYQPDHWETGQFPVGQGKMPALGMRRSDAHAFCEWLSQHEGKIWQYRLPYTKDIESRDRGIWKELPELTGYWIENEQRFAWSQMQIPSSMYVYILEILDRVLDFHLAHALTLDRLHTRVREIDRVRTRVRDYIRTLDLYLDLDHALDLASNSRRASNSDRVLGFDLARSLDRVRNASLTLALDRARDSIHESVLALDLYIQLLILQERRAGRLPAWEGILLVKERQQDV